jgi:hypothetical protein
MTRYPARRLLGTAASTGERVRVYDTPGALEIETIDYFQVQRRRLFFDEVGLVTLHSRRGLPAEAVLLLLVAFGFGAFGAALGTPEPQSRLIAFGLAAVCALAGLGAAVAPVWTVTVFGKRTRARMRFRFRGGKAREVYAQVCRAAAEAQARPSA